MSGHFLAVDRRGAARSTTGGRIKIPATIWTGPDTPVRGDVPGLALGAGEGIAALALRWDGTFAAASYRASQAAREAVRPCASVRSSGVSPVRRPTRVNSRRDDPWKYCRW